jgi:hypothetical protein
MERYNLERPRRQGQTNESTTCQDSGKPDSRGTVGNASRDHVKDSMSGSLDRYGFSTNVSRYCSDMRGRRPRLFSDKSLGVERKSNDIVSAPTW